MKIRSMFSVPLLAVLVLALSGCGVIYSTQSYGSPGTHSVTQGASKSDVFANLGVPNAIYKGEGGEVLLYKYAKGKNILGVYSKITRQDTVIILDENDQSVVWVGQVDVGEGMTILSNPVLDATHPVRTDTLLFDPSNYGVDWELQE